MNIYKWPNLKKFIEIDDDMAQLMVTDKCGDSNSVFDEGTLYAIIHNAIELKIATRIHRPRGAKSKPGNELRSGVRLNRTISIDMNTIEQARKMQNGNFSEYIERLIWEDSLYEPDANP